MGLTINFRWQYRNLRVFRGWVGCVLRVRSAGWLILLASGFSMAQVPVVNPTSVDSIQARRRTDASPSHVMRARRFLGGRGVAGGGSGARAMDVARRQHAVLLGDQRALPRLSPLTTSWQPVGPNQIASLSYGNVTGRVTAVAIDGTDATGNTVYLGTTGGGVWKSTNAAGPAASVSFAPLTDTLPVFSANAGTAAIPSLSIGAVSVQSGVVLAGTGDPNDALDSFYGSGLLRSVDGGLTWTLIQESHDGVAGNHSFTGLGFAGFAWSNTTPGLVVAAVSQAVEGVLVNAIDTTNSVMGLYYSTDAGVTWQMSVVMDGSQVVQTPLPTGANNGGNAATAVAWNPVRQMFYAAVRYHGYYQSADGVTWTRLSSQPGTGLTATACPTRPGGTTGSVACPIFRGALAVQPTTGDMFALSVDRNNLDQGLWQDVCGLSGSSCSNGSVTFGKQLVSSPLEVGDGSTAIAQGDYDLSLAAVTAGSIGSSPDTLVYVGTVDVFRCSLAAGCALRNTTNIANGCAASSNVAPAQHALGVVATVAQPLVYMGNDGGLWRSTDGIDQQATPCSADDATHFDNLNGGLGSLAEVVSFAQDAIAPGTVLMGLGANGTVATGTAASGVAWGQLAAGEGGTVAIDPTNSLLWYGSTAAGVSIRQCSNGAACTATDFSGTPTIGAAQVGGDDSLIDAPWLLDPDLPADVLIGTCRVWRGPASSGALWSSSNAISRLLAGAQNPACASSNGVIRSLAAGGPASSATSAQNAGAEVIYAGMAGTLDGGGTSGGHLFSTTAGGTAGTTTTWADLTASPVSNDVVDLGKFNPGGFDLSSLAVDWHDATGKTVYATVMGFAGNGTNAPHVYRSVDGGSNWMNISSNLPNAPANSVVVDPNDANTVYVALDTGVYVTTKVSNCSGGNCWSIYGTSLPNAPVVELAAATAMATGDGRTGELRAATYGRGLWQIPLLTATSPMQPVMSLLPVALTFAAEAVATASVSQTVTVTNTGNATLTVSQIAVTGDFHETDSCIGGSIAVNASCTMQVSFLPSATGTRSGVLTVYGNVAGGQATVGLSGVGTPAAAMVLNPITLTFASTTIGAGSVAQNITISNTGGTSATLQTPAVTGDFAVTANTCGTTLGPSVGCTVAITFTPTASGMRSGTFTIVDSSGTQSAALTGVGTSPATDTLSLLSLGFAAQQLNTASALQQITLTNVGDVALTLIAAQVTAGDFTAVNACGNSLNAHSSCSIGVAFQPKSVGVGSGVLTVSDEFRLQTVALSGTGIAPPGVSLTPTGGLTFAVTAVGSSAAGQLVTLTNNGGLPLSLQGLGITGDFAVVAGSDTCEASLAIAAACTMQVAFVPSGSGPRSGTLSVTDNAFNSPQSLALTGTGVDFSLVAEGNTTATIANGSNAVYPLLLTPATMAAVAVSFSCSGVPVNATCNVSPSSVTLGGTTVVSVTVDTGVAGAANEPPTSVGRRLVWLAVMLPMGWLMLGRRGLRLMSVGVVCGLMMVGGCGSGRKIPGTATSPVSPGATTPTGTYSIVVSATGLSLTRTVSLTLLVQ